jgi:hypothetical protein
MVHAMDTVFLVAVPFAVLTFVLALLLREVRLRDTSGLMAGAEEVAAPATAVDDLALAAEGGAPVGVDYAVSGETGLESTG